MENLEYTTTNGKVNTEEPVETSIDRLIDALEVIISTYGPAGQLVLSSKSARITKDGAAVAQIIHENEEEDPLVRMITSALWRIAADTGDGTTASSYCLLCLLSEENPPLSEIREGLQRLKPRKWDSKYLIDFVKTVSNDEPEVIQVFSQYGDLPVLARATLRMETHATLVPGFYYQNNHILLPFRQMIIDSPKVHIGDVFTRESFEELLNEGYDLIIGQTNTEIAAFILQTSREGKPPIAILPPPAGSYTEDLREFVHYKGFSKVEVSYPDIVIIPQNPDAQIPERELSSLEHQVEYERRKAVQSGKFIKVEIGAESNEDAVRKLHVWDDVIKALRAAKKGGVVPGGGKSYQKIHPIFSDLHQACLRSPRYSDKALDSYLVVKRSVETALELYETINNISFII